MLAEQGVEVKSLRGVPLNNSPSFTLGTNYVTIGNMLIREDIVEGIYLKQTTERYGMPEGLIAVVHTVGTDWTGEWSFQLRYLKPPTGTRTRLISQWNLNLREKDLAHFELIGPWLSAQALLAASPASTKTKKVPKVWVWMRGKVHPNQLRLFEDF